MEWCLLIDCSLVGSALGLVNLNRRQLEWTWNLKGPLGFRSDLSGALDEGIRHCDGSLASGLRGILVSVGPGSFTGVKVGLAFSYGVLRALPSPGPLIRGTSSLVAAAKSARQATSCESLSLVVPGTRRDGFAVTILSSGEHKVFAFDLDRQSIQFLESTSGQIIGLPWAELQTELAAIGLPFHPLTPGELSRLVINGMTTEVANTWPRGFGRELPRAEFMRPSRPEEKLKLAREIHEV